MTVNTEKVRKFWPHGARKSLADIVSQFGRHLGCLTLSNLRFSPFLVLVFVNFLRISWRTAHVWQSRVFFIHSLTSGIYVNFMYGLFFQFLIQSKRDFDVRFPLTWKSSKRWKIHLSGFEMEDLLLFGNRTPRFKMQNQKKIQHCWKVKTDDPKNQKRIKAFCSF
jgi:hypothetical protein